MRATASATRKGSSSSGGAAGLPLGTAQNPQARVQIFPKIMKVAVPCSQHSPMFGQRALSHTVFNSSVRIRRFKSWYLGPLKNLTRSHSGLGCAAGSIDAPGGCAGTEFEMMLNGEAICALFNYSFYADLGTDTSGPPYRVDLDCTFKTAARPRRRAGATKAKRAHWRFRGYLPSPVFRGQVALSPLYSGVERVGF